MPPELTPKEQVVRVWLQKARNDLESARRLLAEPSPILDTACFHCQQAAEKSLKAFLIWNEHEPPRTHALGMLLDACVEYEPRLVDFRAGCESLTEYAVDSRYPDSSAEPTQDKANAAFEAADTIMSFILNMVPSQVRQ